MFLDIYKKKSLRILTFIWAFIIYVVPSLVFADGILGIRKLDLIVCDPAPGSGKPPCTFDSLFALGKVVIDFIFYLSVPLTVLSFMYAGYLYLTAGGSAGKVSEAKKVMWSVLVGFLWILGAWLVVHAIVAPFINSASGYQLFHL